MSCLPQVTLLLLIDLIPPGPDAKPTMLLTCSGPDPHRSPLGADDYQGKL